MKTLRNISILIVIASLLLAACSWQDTVNWVTGQKAEPTSTEVAAAPTSAPAPTERFNVGDCDPNAYTGQSLDYAKSVSSDHCVYELDPTPTTAPQNTATPEPTATAPEPAATLEVTNTVTQTIAGPTLPITGTLFQTPVKCTKSFNDESKWLVCEPGVLLDNATAWTIPQTRETYYVNVPEGAFTYFALGEGTITVDGVSLELPGENGLNYLVLIRGRIDDGIVDSDLNLTAEVTNFVPGHAIWSHMPTGAYVSHDWFRQQLVASTTKSFTNCGATGCSRVRIVLFDVSTHYYQLFEARAVALDNWTLIEHN